MADAQIPKRTKQEKEQLIAQVLEMMAIPGKSGEELDLPIIFASNYWRREPRKSLFEQTLLIGVLELKVRSVIWCLSCQAQSKRLGGC